MEVTTIGIDLAKNVFAVCGADTSGRVVMRRQLRRAQLLGFMRGLPRCVVGMEATGGAQYWARQFTALGHEVRLMSPALVMPYRKGNKTCMSSEPFGQVINRFKRGSGPSELQL